MTYKEAVENLKILKISEDDSSVGKLKIQTYNIAIEALEKQIPKEPLNREGKSEISYGYCPCCSNLIDNWDDIRFCGECGQAIDWEETE